MKAVLRYFEKPRLFCRGWNRGTGVKPRSAVTKSAGIVMPAATAPVAAPTAISTTVSQMLRTPSIAFCAQIADFRNQFKWLTANSNQPRPRILPRPSPWRSYSPSKGPTRLQCFQWVVMTQVHFGHLARSLGPRGGNGCENPRIWLQTTCAPAAPRTDALATSSWTPRRARVGRGQKTLRG